LRDLAQRNVIFSNNLALLSTQDSLLQSMYEDMPDAIDDNVSSDEEDIERDDDTGDFKPCDLI
jgi:hypothetical protein